ncbi:MAG: S41 family peptidase [Candidatus Kariarchaeaceae archaeon]|jgi:C-terminal processing protease CtpA/Prc
MTEMVHPTVTAERRAELIDQIEKNLQEKYVLDEKIPAFLERLRSDHSNGAYDTDDPAEFATRVNTALNDVYPDKHLNFLYLNLEAGIVSSGGGVRVMRRPQGGDAEGGQGPRVMMKRAPKELPMADEAERKPRVVMGLGGPGLIEHKVLPNNTGYIKIDLFKNLDAAERKLYDTAIDAVKDTDQLIIDLRECRGGTPESIAHLSSFLFGEERVLLAETYFRMNDQTLQRWTTPWEGQSYVGKPVYVLVSSMTGSGGESFAYSLQHLNRGTLVGKNTAGAGLMVDFIELGDFFRFHVSIGRSYDPKSGKGFEFVGVTPDIDVEADDALDLVLEKIAQ